MDPYPKWTTLKFVADINLMNLSSGSSIIKFIIIFFLKNKFNDAGTRTKHVLD